jgi:hypothetical protein
MFLRNKQEGLEQMKVIEQRSGKRVYDFTKTDERPPDETHQREQHIIDAAVSVVLDQIPPQQLSATRDLIAQGMEVLDLQIAAIRHDLGEDGPAENARWWAKATAAQRIKAKVRVRLQNKFGEVQRLIRHHRKLADEHSQKSRERRFIQLVKQYISEETYLLIWQKVNDEFNDAQSGC